MQAIKLVDETRAIGKPKDWNDEENGPCLTLSVSDIELNHCNVMVSGWKPNEEELAMLNEGGHIYLGIYGTTHPVVFLVAAKP